MRGLLLILVLGVAGGALGKLLVGWEISVNEDHFGPLSLEEGFASVEAMHQDFGLPKVEFVNGTEHDFGVMIVNKEGNFDFKIRNAGKAELTLEVSESTCKCTVGKLESSAIAPGETTNVTLTWTAKGSVHEFIQSATIKTNDPLQDKFKLSIKGMLIDSLTLDPPTWQVGDVSSGENIDVKVRVFNFEDEKIEITRAEFVDVDVQETAKVDWVEREVTYKDGNYRSANQAFELSAHIDGSSLKQGKLHQTFRIHFQPQARNADDPIPDPLETVVYGRVVGPLQLLGGRKLHHFDGGSSQFDLGQIKTGDSVEEKLRLVIRGEKNANMAIEVAEVKPDNVFDVKLGAPSEGGTLRSYPITIGVRDTAPVVKLDGSSKDTSGWIIFKPVESDLSPLRLWLKIDITE